MSTFLKILILFLFSAEIIFAQRSDKYRLFQSQEDSLQNYFKLLTKTQKDEEKKILNQKICETLKTVLANEKSAEYQFDSLQKFISILTSDDEKIRFYNWNIHFENGSFQYVAFLQYFSKKSDKWFYISLKDKSDAITNPEQTILCDTNWFGCLYYQVVTKKYKGKKYYTLLGWDGNDDFTNRKIIDVLTFDEQEKICFGSPIFQVDKKTYKRVIFEFAERTTMALRFEKRKNRIIFDRLTPTDSQFKGQTLMSGVSGLTDALKFSKGKWIYFPDIMMENKPQKEKDKKIIYGP